MKQLGTLDTAFINLEHPNTPQHVGGLGIYDPSTAPDGKVRFKGVIANFEQRLNKHTIFRSRLVKVPGNLDRPYWVQDANFDVEFHIRHIALPHPGDWRQLCILISRIHARPLDMNRPLWEAYIIEGLDNVPGVPKGGFAIYTKMHHALVDGAGGSSIMSVIHDLEPNPPETEQAQVPDSVIVDMTPNPLYLTASAAVNQAKNGFKMLSGSVGLVRDLGKMAIGVAKKEIPLPSITSPRTRFNRPVGPYRVFEAVEFPLDDIKVIKNIAEVKMNDVVLCIVGGAMRKYLAHHDELPEEALAVSIPLNMRTRRGATDENNQVGSIFVEVHTNVEDPLERLALIHQSSDEAKIFGENSPMVDVLRLAGVMSPALTKPLLKAYADNELTQHLPLGISSVVSNVAGPPFPLYSTGAKMVRYYGLGLLTPGVGLFHLAFSSDGVVTLSVLGDRDTMSDPAFYGECLVASFNELLDEVNVLEQAKLKAADEALKKAKPARKSAAKKAGAGAKPVARKVVETKAAASSKASSDKVVALKASGAADS